MPQGLPLLLEGTGVRDIPKPHQIPAVTQLEGQITPIIPNCPKGKDLVFCGENQLPVFSI